jgi:hypothetical protein
MVELKLLSLLSYVESQGRALEKSGY